VHCIGAKVHAPYFFRECAPYYQHTNSNIFSSNSDIGDRFLPPDAVPFELWEYIILLFKLGVRQTFDGKII
jgi:hypothetical protein